MSESKFEPTPEAVEREAKRLANLMFVPRAWETLFEWDKEWARRGARLVLRERHEREAPLLDALRFIDSRGYEHGAGDYAARCAMRERANIALASHAALDAPPKAGPTPEERLAEWAREYRASVLSDFFERVDCDITAALAREKERGK